MFNYDIKNLIKEINKVQSDLIEQKIIIKNLENEKEDKKERNYLKFQSRFNEIDKYEKEIKANSDNRFFKYIKLYDFLNSNDITQNTDFEVNEELGCLVKRAKSVSELNSIDKTISIDKKSITYKIKEKIVINSMEYSFYSFETELPIFPKRVVIKYDDYIDDFFENYFRYFNSNNKNSFISRYIFEPKMIKEIIFYFDEEVNVENEYLKLFSIKYKEKNNIKILVDNKNKIKTFNITKKSNEAFKELKFSYSIDDDKYTEIKFEKNESVFTLPQISDFIIRIESDEKEVKQNQKKSIKEKSLESKELISGKGIFKLPDKEISIESLKIVFSYSTTERIKSKLLEFGKKIEDFFMETKGVLTLKQNLIKNIKEIYNDELFQLKFIDSENAFKDNEINFYFDKEKSIIYTPAFFNNYDFYVNYQYKEIENTIASEFYTPILFEFSLKG